MTKEKKITAKKPLKPKSNSTQEMKMIKKIETKQLINSLVRSGIRCGAIDPAEWECLAAADTLSRLVGLTRRYPALRDAVHKHEQEIIQILVSDEEKAWVAARLLSRMTKAIEHFDEEIRRVTEYRHQIAPARLQDSFWKCSREPLDTIGITDDDLINNVVKTATEVFAQFAEHVLQFTPSVDPDDDPSTGPKLWMLLAGPGRDPCDLSDVSYEWPAEASVLVHHRQYNCEEQTLRAALLCLQNAYWPSDIRSYSSRDFPLATVEGTVTTGERPYWPPEHGPYTLHPPVALGEFLYAVKVGTGLTKGPERM